MFDIRRDEPIPGVDKARIDFQITSLKDLASLYQSTLQKFPNTPRCTERSDSVDTFHSHYRLCMTSDICRTMDLLLRIVALNGGVLSRICEKYVPASDNKSNDTYGTGTTMHPPPTVITLFATTIIIGHRHRVSNFCLNQRLRDAVKPRSCIS